LGNLEIAKVRRAEKVRILETRIEHAENHLNDGMQAGSLGADYARMAQAQRQAKLQSIETMKAQIEELEGLEGEALKARFCPDVLRPAVSRGNWLGPILDPA
jgi:hypothetical protein